MSLIPEVGREGNLWILIKLLVVREVILLLGIVFLMEWLTVI